MIQWYRYMVCCSVPKPNTIPIPVIPVTDSRQVFLYLCLTLGTRTRILVVRVSKLCHIQGIKV